MSTTEETKSGGNKGLVVVLVIIIVALGGLSTYLFSEKSELEATISTQAEELDVHESEIDDLTADLETKIAEYNQLKSEYEELGLEKDELDSKIQELEEQVQKYKNASWANAKELKRIRKELQLTNAKHEIALAEKDQEIERYKLMADSLATSVDSLLVEQGVAAERIEDLASKVEIASILKAENVTTAAINAKGKEDTDGAYKAKNTAKIKVTFNLADNKVAKKDDKEIVFRLIQPDKSVVFDLASGGGSFTDAEGNTDFFTSKKTLAFENSKQQVDFIYLVPEEELLAEGTYTIELFAEGHQIGSSTFTVK